MSGGIELAISLPSDNDHVPITLQVLEVANSTSSSSGTSSVACDEAIFLMGIFFLTSC